MEWNQESHEGKSNVLFLKLGVGSWVCPLIVTFYHTYMYIGL